jgi:hypothetical protein
MVGLLSAFESGVRCEGYLWWPRDARRWRTGALAGSAMQLFLMCLTICTILLTSGVLSIAANGGNCATKDARGTST